MMWLVLLSLGTARAERPLAFADALAAAERANPSLARAGLSVEQADASVLSSKGFLDPSLGLDVGWRRSEQKGFFQGFPYDAVSQTWDFGGSLRGTLPTGTTWNLQAGLDYDFSEYTTEFVGESPTEATQLSYTTNTSVSITQPLLQGYRLAWNMRTVTRARDGLTIAELTRERARQSTLAEAAGAYWSWVYRERLVEIAEQNQEVAQESLRIGQLRQEAGELAPVEVTRLEAALVQAEAEVIDARIAAEQAADDLLLLMGETPDQDIEPATPLGEVPPLELDTDAAVDVAMAQNLELAVDAAEVEQARHEHGFARHATLPSLSAVASAGVGAQEETLGAAVTGLTGEENFPYYTVGGEFSVPLGNRAARGEVQRTAASLKIAELRLEERERVIRSQVQQQVRQLSQARRRVELADINLRLAEETLAAEESLERAGRSIQKDVLEARAEVVRARTEAAKARADYRLAQTELLRLQGQIDLAAP